MRGYRWVGARCWVAVCWLQAELKLNRMGPKGKTRIPRWPFSFPSMELHPTVRGSVCLVSDQIMNTYSVMVYNITLQTGNPDQWCSASSGDDDLPAEYIISMTLSLSAHEIAHRYSSTLGRRTARGFPSLQSSRSPRVQPRSARHSRRTPYTQRITTSPKGGTDPSDQPIADHCNHVTMFAMQPMCPVRAFTHRLWSSVERHEGCWSLLEPGSCGISGNETHANPS